MELHLGLALSTDFKSRAHNANTNKTHFPNLNHVFHHKNKRTFSQIMDHAQEEEEEETSSTTTLSLLPLTPGHSDDHHHQHYNQSSTTTITKSDEDDEESLVGRPPVNDGRKKLRYSENDIIDDEVGDNIVEDHVVSIHVQRNYVKVKMEGVVIARKIDLNMHHSFHTLNQTLMDMFHKCTSNDEQLNNYELVYQDKEGDWLLAQDVSWRSFIQCAQRLKLLKSRG